MPFIALNQTLKAHGQSVTACRQQVFAALSGQEPLSMVELVRRCPDTNRASVYRTVALYEKLGIVLRLQTGWKYKLELSDRFHDHHHHATCLECGVSLVIPEDSALEQQFHELSNVMGFTMERHQLEIQGYCSKCQNKRPLKKAR